MVGVLILAKTMYTYFLLLFAIAAANENQPGTVDVRVLILVKIVHMLYYSYHSNSKWESARHSRW